MPAAMTRWWREPSGVRRPAKLLAAFAAGCIATTAVSWIADLNAQGTSPSVLVCVASDRTLRIAGVSGACAAGQTQMWLTGTGGQGTNGGQQNEQTQPRADDGRVAELARRVAELESAAIGGKLTNRVVAPFEVVDRGGNRVFYVPQPENGVATASLFSNGADVARLVATPYGGQIVGASSHGGTNTGVYLGVFAQGQQAGVRVLENSNTRLELGKSESGRYLFRVRSADGKVLAGIGENTGHTGSAQVADQSGGVRAILSVNQDGNGSVDIVNESARVVARVSQGANEAGLLRLLGNDGQTPMVEAGMGDGGYGVVRAGPEGFKPGLGLLGLPGSYIAGKPKP